MPRHPHFRLIGAAFAAVLLVPLLASAGPVNEYAELEDQLAETAGTVDSLEDEIRLLDATITLRQKQLAAVQRDVRLARNALTQATDELVALHDRRQAAQTMLGQVVRADYLSEPPDQLDIMVSGASSSEELQSISHLNSVETMTERLGERLSKLQGEYAERRQDRYQEYQQLDTLERQAAAELAGLAALQKNKSILLAETAGEEARYRERHAAAKQQLEEMGIFARQARADIEPKVWDEHGFYFNQLDARWIDATLGFSRTSTLGDYGCGVASLAMVYKSYGLDTDPLRLNAELKRTRAFAGDLLDWRNVAAASGGRLTLANRPYPFGPGSTDWNLIDRQLSAGNPVIVYVDRPEQSLHHYVVLLQKEGDAYLMHDPIEGPDLTFQDFYRKDSVIQTVTFRRT